ncbi:hypothetical protein Caci_2607 [Catenulispora acidiphila DSM 44928]|uniref:Uncharacterized protein n=1 Tax=Catenulispora acidiphila (strain DSM 44928 / JCM 14897 / NBRC 102108 / NRRL B-24433 / ID139908) TaxID=479433 RepID=C7PXS1_CATAD|nr:hypothetical protein [Catenulispora acidiphila]ACU71524.1 hypothetical protein Caci_2607 [Catenulispora acidiphila DSM 44928]
MKRTTPHRPRHSLTARTRRALTGALLVAAVTTGTTLIGVPSAVANAPDTTVTVDVSQTGKVPTHAGAGFLYGLSQDGSGPSDSLLQPLAPTLFRGGGARLAGGGWIGDGYTAGSGYRTRIQSGIAQARRVTTAPYNGRYDLLVSDLYGADTTQPSNTVYPCDNGDCSNWKAFIDQVVGDVQASGVNVAYDIWNEPDGTGFWQRGVNSAQYYQMWDTAVREIRRLSPSATIVGPSYSGYNHTWLDGFIGQTKADGTVPSVLNWHFGTDPAADSADAAAIVAAHGVSPLPLSINEYLFGNQQTAGYTAWFLDRLAVSNVGAAAHAIWSDCCVAGTLDSVLGGTGALAAPTGQWWTYRAYASLTGNLVSASSGNTGVAVAASADRNAGQANVLIGNNSGQTGTTTVTVQGLGSTPWLTAGSTVHATLLRIPDSTPLSQPIAVSDSDVTVSNGRISLPATFQSGTDAFWLVLSPHGVTITGPGGPGGGQIFVDGNEIGTANDQWQYDASWGETSGVADMYAGTANWSNSSGATAKFKFSGTQVAVHAVRDVDQGKMTVAIDGGSPTTIDNYASSRNASGVVWTSPTLAVGSHTLTVVNTGTRNGSSSGTNIAIDRVDVTPSSAAPPSQTVVDGNVTGTGSGQFSYGANWGLTTGVSDMYLGTANWSHTAGASATFRFTGTQVALHAVRDTDQGIMTVAIDGGSPTTIDNYASSRNASGIVWTSPTLAAGSHTLTIINTGNHNSASTGINIAIDRADVTS